MTLSGARWAERSWPTDCDQLDLERTGGSRVRDMTAQVAPDVIDLTEQHPRPSRPPASTLACDYTLTEIELR